MKKGKKSWFNFPKYDPKEWVHYSKQDPFNSKAYFYHTSNFKIIWSFPFLILKLSVEKPDESYSFLRMIFMRAYNDFTKFTSYRKETNFDYVRTSVFHAFALMR